MIDYYALLSALKEEFADECEFLTRNRQAAVGDKVVVQYKVDQETLAVTARILRRARSSRYVPLEQIKELIQQELQAKERKSCVVETIDTYGEALLKKLNASWEWMSNNYWDVHIPQTEELPHYRGWLKFGDYEPRRRKWKELFRTRLHSSGMYAWFVRLDTEKRLAKLYYMSVGKDMTFATEWFHWALLHPELVRVTAHADLYKWRQRELMGSMKKPDAEELQLAIAEAKMSKLELATAQHDAEVKALEAKRAAWVAACLAEEAERVAQSKNEETGGVIQTRHILG